MQRTGRGSSSSSKSSPAQEYSEDSILGNESSPSAEVLGELAFLKRLMRSSLVCFIPSISMPQAHERADDETSGAAVLGSVPPGSVPPAPSIDGGMLLGSAAEADVIFDGGGVVVVLV
jgi:hypothetical protein